MAGSTPGRKRYVDLTPTEQVLHRLTTLARRMEKLRQEAERAVADYRRAKDEWKALVQELHAAETPGSGLPARRQLNARTTSEVAATLDGEGR